MGRANCGEARGTWYISSTLGTCPSNRLLVVRPSGTHRSQHPPGPLRPLPPPPPTAFKMAPSHPQPPALYTRTPHAPKPEKCQRAVDLKGLANRTPRIVYEPSESPSEAQTEDWREPKASRPPHSPPPPPPPPPPAKDVLERLTTPPRPKGPSWENTKFTVEKIWLGHFWYPNFWVPTRVALEGKGPQKQLGRRLEAVAKAVGGGYCHLQMPLKLALAVRETVAGRRLGALEGGRDLPPPSHASLGPTPLSPPF